MATITVKKIPDDLYGQLREAAKLHRRSINSEIIVCLETALRSQPVSAEEIVARARRLRQRQEGRTVCVSELLEAENTGRR
ncbi:MAG: Arc family DNA-binding protein [Acidobacteriota bacterium]